MHRILGVFLLVFVGIAEIRATYVVDSLNKKQGFSALVSFKPAVRWLAKKDSLDNFFYSNTQFEVQYHFKRHVIGLGFNGNYKRFLSSFNGLPNRVETTSYSYAPYYCFQLCSIKKWKCYTGVSYLYNYHNKLTITESPIENISKTTKTIEEGAGLFFRINYSLNKHISLELESTIYYTRMREDIREDFPLTPSLNSLKSNYIVSATYAIPSNLFIKYSF